VKTEERGTRFLQSLLPRYTLPHPRRLYGLAVTRRDHTNSHNKKMYFCYGLFNLSTISDARGDRITLELDVIFEVGLRLLHYTRLHGASVFGVTEEAGCVLNLVSYMFYINS
jgi:hypothetical protein